MNKPTLGLKSASDALPYHCLSNSVSPEDLRATGGVFPLDRYLKNQLWKMDTGCWAACSLNIHWCIHNICECEFTILTLYVHLCKYWNRYESCMSHVWPCITKEQTKTVLLQQTISYGSAPLSWSQLTWISNSPKTTSGIYIFETYVSRICFTLYIHVFHVQPRLYIYVFY